MKRYGIWYRLHVYQDEIEQYEHLKDIEGDWETVKQLFVTQARGGAGTTYYLTEPDLVTMPENVYGEARYPRAVKRNRR